MRDGTVAVVIGDEIRWTRHTGATQSGISATNRSFLMDVLSLLVEATEQVTVQLRALDNLERIPYSGLTATEVDDDVPKTGMRDGDPRGKVFEIAPVIPKRAT